MPKKKSLIDVLFDFRSVHGDTYDYSLVEYKHSTTKIKIICKKHGLFEQIANVHRAGHGCPLCGSELRSSTNCKGVDAFVEDARRIHDNRYDYSLVEYINTSTKVKIVCVEHGIFEQSPNAHTNINKPQGCKECGVLKRSKNRLSDISYFIEKATGIHVNRYDYSLVDYKSNHVKVNIICKIHGIFEQSPNAHLRGDGCRACSRNAPIDFSSFLEKAHQIHGDKFDYTKVKFKNMKCKIEIICNVHGVFKQSPSCHLKGQGGCPVCARRMSKKETDWLDYLQVPCRQYPVKFKNFRKMEADGFDPTTNTVYEFHGDMWHGNPSIFDPNEINPVSGKTYGELYRYTIEKEDRYRFLGYNVVSIWESDWDAQQKARLNEARLSA